MDVQVSPEEWKKYPFPEQDMRSSLAILSDLQNDVQKLNRHVVNPLVDLRSIQPAGFLDGDIHMDPAGHAQIAQSIHNVLKKPLPHQIGYQ